MTVKDPSSMPELHRQFLDRLVEGLRVDTRIVGVAAGGSFLTNSMDEFSDLDLVIAAEPEHYVHVMAERVQIAASLGELLAAFTGEHVGEPRVLICLYAAPASALSKRPARSQRTTGSSTRFATSSKETNFRST